MTTANTNTFAAWHIPQNRLLLFVVLLTGAICLMLEGIAPWLIKFPDEWTLPLISLVGSGLEAFLNAIKPVMRFISWLLGFPMAGANWLLTSLPWPFLIGTVTALGWYLGGRWLAALGFFGLGFVLLSGYWSESMNTLSLVAVSVPLAISIGGLFGILANELPRFKAGLLAILDAMQTIPTFAYLTPLLLLFGFGPVVGLIASTIYAVPPMARNTLLGLERVEPEIKEAAIMSGGTRLQRLFQVEIPAGIQQIMVGVNQCLMASLSMVIIAAVIGGFNDIGWEVLLTMRKAQFGQALLAGLVIVAFAIVIDRMSAALAKERVVYSTMPTIVIFAIGILASIPILLGQFSGLQAGVFEPVANVVDESLGNFTANNGQALNDFKNNVMFFGMLPIRIGLDDAVLPFTWGFQWTPGHSLWFFAVAVCASIALILLGRWTLAAGVLLLAGTLETGISQMPWPFVFVAVAALAFAAQGAKLAMVCCLLLASILFAGLWERALLSLYLSGVAVFACALIGGLIGLASSYSTIVWRIVQPICDMLQTIPLFVFLIPVLMFFQIGEFSAFLAICAYAIVPMIRYTRHGLTNTPAELIEAGQSSGANQWQMLWDVKIPYAAPTILLGLNQTVLYAFAMLVIAALIGTTGLGQSIYLALGQADVGMGVSAGASMAILALIADRIIQGFAEERRMALGL